MTAYQKWQIILGLLFLVCTVIVVIQETSPNAAVAVEVPAAEGGATSGEVTVPGPGSTVTGDDRFDKFLSRAGSVIGLIGFIFFWRKDKRESERHTAEMAKMKKKK